MEDRLDALEGPGHGLVIAHVADLELGLGREVGGPRPIRAVHLGDEAVEHAHLVPGGEQPVDQMRAHESGTACHQDLHDPSPWAGAPSPQPAGQPRRCHASTVQRACQR